MILGDPIPDPGTRATNTTNDLIAEHRETVEGQDAALAKARADERERIAQAIEHFALVWTVYLDSQPTGIERQLAWSRVDALEGAARIARNGGRDG